MKVYELYDYAYNRYGRDTNYSFDNSKPKIISYFDTGNLEFFCCYDNRRHADKIIKANTGFEFLFYIHCPLSDTTRIIEMLDKSDNDFTVMLDTEGKITKQLYNPEFTAITFVVNGGDNYIFECPGIFGSPTFDEGFPKYGGWTTDNEEIWEKAHSTYSWR